MKQLLRELRSSPTGEVTTLLGAAALLWLATRVLFACAGA